MKKLFCFLFIFYIDSACILQAQWVQTDGPYGGTVNCFAVLEANIFAGTAGCGVYPSTNNGTSWMAVNMGLTSTYVVCLAVSGTNIFASTNYQNTKNSSGVYLSTNNGANWTAVNNGLTNTDVSCLAVLGANLFAGTYGHGVWMRPLSDMITGVNEQNNLPASFSLRQNYPNPFNPTTTINYSIPKSTYVTKKVYDILGREVTTLVNENKPVGNYSVQFDAGKLVSGVYFYRMDSGSFMQTKKIILIK